MASLKLRLAPLLSQTKFPRLASTGAALTQQFADQAGSKWKFWGKGKSQTAEKLVEEYEAEAEAYHKYAQELEKEARNEYIESRRNKSRLSFSHQQIVNGRPPYDGLVFEYKTQHQTHQFKREMLAKYGLKSGVDPAISWPPDGQIELAKEWERLYQPEPLSVMMDKAWKEVHEEKEARIQREAEIDRNLEIMEKQMKQWQEKVNAKNKLAEEAIQRRERILAELKQELGYDVNPQDRHMIEKIAEKEKVLLKEEKEAKKILKAEKEAKRREMIAKRNAESS